MAMDGDRWLSAKAAAAAGPDDLPVPDGRRGAARRLAGRCRRAGVGAGGLVGAGGGRGHPRARRGAGGHAGVRAAGAGAGRGRVRHPDALADVRTLHERMASDGPPAPAVRALVQAWAAVALAPVRVMLCAGFATAEHLRARFAELYRDALPDGLAVLAVEVPEAGSGWEARDAAAGGGRAYPVGLRRGGADGPHVTRAGGGPGPRRRGRRDPVDDRRTSGSSPCPGTCRPRPT